MANLWHDAFHDFEKQKTEFCLVKGNFHSVMLGGTWFSRERIQLALENSFWIQFYQRLTYCITAYWFFSANDKTLVGGVLKPISCVQEKAVGCEWSRFPVNMFHEFFLFRVFICFCGFFYDFAWLIFLWLGFSNPNQPEAHIATASRHCRETFGRDRWICTLKSRFQISNCQKKQSEIWNEQLVTIFPD